jgi:8-oxo-dGTP pyrophosphatase MutT (NUDIX family)
VPRPTVKLLLLDEQDRLLLIHSRDPRSGQECWYPVGGGLEPGETVQQAAVREAAEETGLHLLPVGAPVWTRDHTYRYDGREVQVHEDWLLHRVEHFRPDPAALTDYERRTIVGFHWWSIEDLVTTAETVFPPRLGQLLSSLMENGVPSIAIDITD